MFISIATIIERTSRSVSVFIRNIWQIAERIINVFGRIISSVFLNIGIHSIDTYCRGEPFGQVKTAFVIYIKPVVAVIILANIVMLIVDHDIIAGFVG